MANFSNRLELHGFVHSWTGAAGSEDDSQERAVVVVIENRSDCSYISGSSCCHYFISLVLSQRETADAEINIPNVENPELTVVWTRTSLRMQKLQVML